MLALVVLTLLCSSYCAGMAVPNMTLPDDGQNWANMWNHQKLNPPLSRTSDPNETLLDIIIRVNAEARGKANSARTGDSNFLFEADIAMNKSEVLKLMSENSKGKHRGKRAVMKKTRTSLWQRNIPYVLSSQLSNRAKGVIRSAIVEWQRTLYCMGNWVDVTTGRKPRDYLYFFTGGGCFSQVGHTGGAQRVSIGRGCEYHGIAVHEIGHAMGLWHEQSRPDRDQFVKINWNNIVPGMAFNFQKYTTARINSLGESYDYESVMHYGAYAFAKVRGAPTIVNVRGNQTLGQRNGLSVSDKKQVQLLYGCTPTATTKPPGTTKPSGTTKPPGTTKPSVCRNMPSHSNWCSESKKLGLCSNSLFRSYMTTHCCSSCRITTPAPSGCVRDIQTMGNCVSWKRRGFCAKGNKYNAYMMKNCCKTCQPTVCRNMPSHSNWCSESKKLGLCSNSLFRSYMTTHCCSSCRITTPAPSGCVRDIQTMGNCVSWKWRGFCAKGNKYNAYMMKNCCKTCQPTVPKQNCVDKATRCSVWKKGNYCTNPKYIVYMKQNCSKSCGSCNST